MGEGNTAVRARRTDDDTVRGLSDGGLATTKLTAQKRIEEEVMAKLAELGGRGFKEEDIVFEGTKFVLPENTTLKESINFLEQRAEQEEKLTAYNKTFRYRPWDGAYATQAALRRAFGAIGAKSTWSFFGEQLPQLVTIATGPHTQEQVPWGALTLPILPNSTIYLGNSMSEEFGPLFHVQVEAPRKFRHQIEGIFKLIQKELETNSIYKGKAIDGKTQPDFIDTAAVDPSKVIFSDEAFTQLSANVWSLLRHTEVNRQVGLPLKRAVLLEGPYGTGKTLAANLTAKIAVENGWTFLICRPGRDDLQLVMQTARLYQPSVVFFEDIDTIAEGNGDFDVSKLLDLFDGITAKHTELMVVLTTNHAEKIHKGMVRPGRLDAIVHIGSLDQNGIERMIHAIVPEDLLSPDLDMGEIASAMRDYLPAFVKEAIDRALRYGIARAEGFPGKLTTEDFVEAANGLRPQLDLMNGAGEGVAGDPFQALVEKAVSSVVHSTYIDDGERLVSSNGHH